MGTLIMIALFYIGAGFLVEYVKFKQIKQEKEREEDHFEFEVNWSKILKWPEIFSGLFTK